LARERQSGRSTGWAWSGGRGGAGRLIGLILMVLINGRARIVRELVEELNLGSVEVFLRLSGAV